jgi:NAD(P)-dependent dehydrogenase (short-subunit alcohol dehydrogenase family)
LNRLTRQRGAKGIGLETTIYLASKGATVYVAARNSESNQTGVAEARKRLKLDNNNNNNNKTIEDSHEDKRIKFHELDLSSMQSAWSSAQEFKKIEQRLDILVCNAGVSMTTMQKLSPDGFDTMFTTNHLGHFAFTMGLLGIYPTHPLLSFFCDRI